MRGLLVIAVVSLAAGIWVLFAFCHGTTGFSFGIPVSATSIHIDMTTTGAAAIVGLALTIGGAFLLVVATIIALIGMRGRKASDLPARQREKAFEE